jgi:hypothetical protein
LKERAEQRASPEGYKKLWHEPIEENHSDASEVQDHVGSERHKGRQVKQLGVEFGEIQEQVISELSQYRRHILSSQES